MNNHPLDDDSHTSGQHRAKKTVPRPSMDRELHDSSGAASRHDIEQDDGECSESGFGSDEDSFGAASDNCEPDQSYLESVLEDYHPERVNLLDQSVPEPITKPKVEAVTQERRLSRPSRGSAHMMKSRDLIMKDLEDSSDSDSNTKEKENKKQQSQSSVIVSEPAIPNSANGNKKQPSQSSGIVSELASIPNSTNGTAPTVAIDASESADGDGDGDVYSTNNNASKTATKQEQSTEDSESGVGEGEAEDQFPSSPVPPPSKQRLGSQNNRPPDIFSRPGLESQGNSTKKSFRSINGKNFWSKPFRKVVKTMKRGSSKKDKNIDPSSS